MVSRIIHFVGEEIWTFRLKDLPPVQRFFIRYPRTLILAFYRFYSDQCPLKASALTYYTLLSIVPVLAMVFGAAKGFGLEDLIEKQVRQLAERANWQVEIADRVIAFSHSLLQNAKGGVIAGIGVILVFWAVISILGEVENSFNQIWEVREARSVKRKFADYISIMVLAPFLQIISSSVAVLVAGRVKVIFEKIALLGVFSPVVSFLLRFVPYLSIWILLTMLYLVMPNTKVRVKSAILAGVITGTIYQIVQWVYIKFQIGVTNYGPIYGSFAALPLFLVWLQLSWMIVLLGAEIAFADENHETFGYHPDFSRISLYSRELLVLRIFHLLVKRFSQGEEPFNTRQIAHTLEIPVRLARSLLYELIRTGLVVETVAQAQHEVGFQPGKTIENATVKYTLDAYVRHGIDPLSLPLPSDGDKIYACLKSISECVEKAPGNVVLKEI